MTEVQDAYLIFDIIQELNQENGSNYKIKVLKKYADNELLKRVLKMTYDKVAFNYGVGKTTLEKLTIPGMDAGVPDEIYSVTDLLDILDEEFCSREVTGNAAIERLQHMFSNCDKESKFILQKIIERDLRINLGKTQINKVWKSLITKPCYQRCDTFNKKTAKNITFPAIIQKKI